MILKIRNFRIEVVVVRLQILVELTVGEFSLLLFVVTLVVDDVDPVVGQLVWMAGHFGGHRVVGSLLLKQIFDPIVSVMMMLVMMMMMIMMMKLMVWLLLVVMTRFPVMMSPTIGHRPIQQIVQLLIPPVELFHIRRHIYVELFFPIQIFRHLGQVWPLVVITIRFMVVRLIGTIKTIVVVKIDDILISIIARLVRVFVAIGLCALFPIQLLWSFLLPKL
jgi:hypothetical protein